MKKQTLLFIVLFSCLYIAIGGSTPDTKDNTRKLKSPKSPKSPKSNSPSVKAPKSPKEQKGKVGKKGKRGKKGKKGKKAKKGKKKKTKKAKPSEAPSQMPSEIPSTSMKPSISEAPSQIPSKTPSQVPSTSMVPSISSSPSAETFDLQDCGSYSMTWLVDLNNSCDFDPSTGDFSSCQCSDAQRLIDKGLIDCKTATCPDSCTLCEDCLKNIINCISD